MVHAIIAQPPILMTSPYLVTWIVGACWSLLETTVISPLDSIGVSPFFSIGSNPTKIDGWTPTYAFWLGHWSELEWVGGGWSGVE